MITYAFDSSGEIVKAHMENPYFAPEGKRLEALNAIRLTIMPYLRPFDANDKTFSVAIQPYGYEDRLIWFTKIHAESDSEIVKMSQSVLRNKNYVFDSKTEEYLFNSIFKITEDEKDSWYLLYAESLCFKRNIFDKKIIDIVFEDPVPYGEFITKNKDMRISKKELVMEERTDKMKFLSANISFENKDKLLEIALPRTGDKNLDAHLREGLKDVLSAVEKRDKYSNDKTTALMYLVDDPADRGDTENVYNELTQWAAEEFNDDDKLDITYKMNVLTITKGQDKADVYVCTKPEEQKMFFVSNGKVFDDTDRLKKYIKSKRCFESAPDWWEEIITILREEKLSKA